MRLRSITIAFNFGETQYLLGRTVGLAARPTYLLACNYFFGNAAAALLASAFLLPAMLTAISGVDAHRLFYTYRFGEKPRNAAPAYVRYVCSSSFVALVGGVVCLGYFGLAEHEPWLGAVVALYFLSERLAEETLRFFLFQRDRSGWGRLMITRVAVQSLLMIVVVILPDGFGIPPILFIACMLIGNAVAFGRHLPVTIGRRALKGIALFRRYGFVGFRHLVRSGPIWLLSLAGMMGGYVDRLIVLMSAKDNIAVFSLVVSSMAIIINGIDYFFFSQRRRDFLNGTICFSGALRSRRLWTVMGCSLLVGIILTVVSTALYRGEPHMPIIVPICVALMQMTLGVSMVAREIAYWNNQVDALLRTEVLFLLALGAIFTLLYPLHLHYVWLLPPALCALLLRLVLLARIPNERILIS